jgi:hypothetical protein
LTDRARERIGTINEVANALADNLPAPKQHAGKSRRRRRKKKSKAQQAQQAAQAGKPDRAQVTEAAARDGQPEPAPAPTVEESASSA